MTSKREVVSEHQGRAEQITCFDRRHGSLGPVDAHWLQQIAYRDLQQSVKSSAGSSVPIGLTQLGLELIQTRGGNLKHTDMPVIVLATFLA